LTALLLPKPKTTGASGGVGGAVKIATQLVHPEKVIDDPYMASNTPIYQTATFGQPTATTFGPYDYTRSGNPTRTVLEKQMAALEGAHGARAVCCVRVRVRVCLYAYGIALQLELSTRT
jgi:cystathionine beta-lyase/cystathionine gamma-synthase